MNLTPRLLVTAGIGLAALSAPAAYAQSLTITYSLGAFSYTQSPTPGSSFSLNARSQTLMLNPGINDITNAQGVFFTANFQAAQSTSDGTASRSMTINGVGGTVSQPFTISTDTTTDANSGDIVADDSLSLMPGNTTTFNLGSQGTVTYTPRSYGDFGEQQGTYANNTPGRFVYTPAAAPEPSEITTLSLMGLGLGALLLRARKRTARAA